MEQRILAKTRKKLSVMAGVGAKEEFAMKGKEVQHKHTVPFHKRTKRSSQAEMSGRLSSVF